MQCLKSKRLWVLVAIVVGLFLLGRWLDRSQPIQSYRVIDDYTIAVELDASSPQWTRITNVTETSERVVINVGSFIIPWAQAEAGVGHSQELVVRLQQPLGSRPVVDGYTGVTVEWVDCNEAAQAQGQCPGQSGPA
jgi:hypothetical protein